MKVLGVIPARYGSSRFPGKPLAMIRGKSMIQWVYENACGSEGLDDVVIATDDRGIFDHAQGFTESAIMTRSDHPSGTDRCWEAFEKLGEAHDIVINIQGDEPFLPSKQIDKVIEQFDAKEVDIATLARPFHEAREGDSPDRVKVVFDRAGNALYFSRAAIPYQRDDAEDLVRYEHIGIYGYRGEVLKDISHMQSSRLEALERLEQLRWLENGFRIRVGLTDIPSRGIDTPEDLKVYL